MRNSVMESLLLTELTVSDGATILNPHCYRIFVWIDSFLSIILWWFLTTYDKKSTNSSAALEGPSKSLSIYFSILIFLSSSHPLTFVLSLWQSCLFHKYIILFLTSEPLFLFLQCFPFPPGKLLFIPQGPVQILYTACRAFQISLGRVRGLTLCAPWYIFLL